MMPLLAAAPILVAMAWFDLRLMRIPNVLSLALVGLFVVAGMLHPPTFLLARLAIAGLTFLIGFAAFAANLLGAGDVKALSTLLLLVPAPQASAFALELACALAVTLAILLPLRLLPASAGGPWEGLRRSRHFPMGVSIALAGLAHPWVMASLGPAAG